MSIKSPGTGKKYQPDAQDAVMARSIKLAAKQFEEQQETSSPETIRAQRNETAIRQFLLFLVFFIIASAVLFRHSLARWLLSLDETLEPQKQNFGQNFRDLSDETQRQNQLLKEIGYGSNAQ